MAINQICCYYFQKFNVKISDFGLAKYGPDNEHDHLSTTVNGTKGYFAPEYFKKGNQLEYLSVHFLNSCHTFHPIHILFDFTMI